MLLNEKLVIMNEGLVGMLLNGKLMAFFMKA